MDMSRQDGKVFIGGLSWETTDIKLKRYFQNFGEVQETYVSYDRHTGRPRGFGFVVFADPIIADKVVSQQHTIDRRVVEAKKALPREESPVSKDQQAAASGQRTKKIFVGGLAAAIDESTFKAYFEEFGTVEDAVVMYDHDNQRPRGFGFITFTEEEAVDKVFNKGAIHVLNEKQIEIKRAVPRDAMPSPRMMFRSPQPPGQYPGGSPYGYRYPPPRERGFGSPPPPLPYGRGRGMGMGGGMGGMGGGMGGMGGGMGMEYNRGSPYRGGPPLPHAMPYTPPPAGYTGNGMPMAMPMPNTPPPSHASAAGGGDPSVGGGPAQIPGNPVVPTVVDMNNPNPMGGGMPPIQSPSQLVGGGFSIQNGMQAAAAVVGSPPFALEQQEQQQQQQQQQAPTNINDVQQQLSMASVSDALAELQQQSQLEQQQPGTQPPTQQSGQQAPATTIWS